MKTKPTRNTTLRNTFFIYVFLPFLSVVLYSFKQNTGPTSRPNIVFILADDQGWRDLGYRGSRYDEMGKEELYNLKEDTGEKNDLSLLEPRQKKKLSKKMDRWLRKTHAPLPLQKNPAFDEKAYQQQLEKIKALTHENN